MTKLSLAKETLRHISPAEAVEAVGGNMVVIQTRFCTFGCPPQTVYCSALCTEKITCICPV